MARTLRQLFVSQYELCAVRPGELIAVIAELGRKQDYVAAAVEAAQDLGVEVFVLTAGDLSAPVLPPIPAPSPGRDVQGLLAGAAEADLIVDVTVGGLIHSDIRTRILGQGARMLFVAEPPQVLERLMGSAEVRERVVRAGDVLRSGSTIQVSSEAGTDLTADITGDDLPITHQWGFVESTGRWDHWPSGFVACFPRDRSAEGLIVLAPGDVLIPFNHRVGRTVSITVREGFIVDIRGDGIDAQLLSDYFSYWDDPDAWAISHVGWGVHPTASWSALDVYDPQTLYGQELRSAAGNFMWSTGSNRFAGRETPAHLDIPMRGCTVQVDDLVVVKDGLLQE